MEEATFNMIDLPVELGKLRIENVIPKGDELVQIIEGSGTLYLVTDEEIQLR